MLALKKIYTATNIKNKKPDIKNNTFHIVYTSLLCIYYTIIKKEKKLDILPSFFTDFNAF